MRSTVYVSKQARYQTLMQTATSFQSFTETSRLDSPAYDGDSSFDDNVLPKSSMGTKVISAHWFGVSSWTVTARLHLQLPEDTEERCFLKPALDTYGCTLMEGEFNAMSELYNWALYPVLKPHSWG